MLLLLTITSLILFLHLELSGIEIHVQEVLLPLRWVLAEVLVICHTLVEARGNTIQDDIDQEVIRHLSIDIESIDIS